MGGLQALGLSRNQIGDEGMQAFSAAISSGSMGSLQQLWLGRNAIGDAGMIAFADALKSPIGFMGGLQALGLSRNQIGDEGMKAFSAAISSGSLASLIDLVVDDKEHPHSSRLLAISVVSRCIRVHRCRGCET